MPRAKVSLVGAFLLGLLGGVVGGITAIGLLGAGVVSYARSRMPSRRDSG